MDRLGRLVLAGLAIAVVVVPGAAQDAAATRFLIELGTTPATSGLDPAPRAVVERCAFPGAGVADFADPRARITFAPHAGFGVRSSGSFTLDVELRIPRGSDGFATILMCREGGTVHYSLVLGRTPGHVSLELWDWNRTSARSDLRLDDGEWHRVTGVFDAQRRQSALVVDGRVHAVHRVSRDFTGSAAPGLRLGNNLDEGVNQPFPGALRGVALRDGIDAAYLEHRTVIELTSAVYDPGNTLLPWLDRMRRKRAPNATDAAAWRTRAARLRAQVQDALGLWPPPYSGRRLLGAPSPITDGGLAATDFATFRPELPLDVRRGGTIERDAHRVTRVYWQTFAGFYSSGWLYEPRDGTAPRPAILCPHGHWADGARHQVVQARCVVLARLGYTVLAVDSLHVEDPRIALSPVAAMTWNNLRGLELLRSLPEVDAARIGCTGASGGGQQTYYLTALDSGLAAAVPVAMAAHFHEILFPGEVHCHCNHVPHLVRVADMPEMAAAFAPNPQLFLTVTGDWTKNFGREGWPEIAAIYERLDARAHVAHRQWDKGHAYDREMRNAMYAFFEKELRGVATPDAELEATEAPTEPREVLLALDRRDVPRDPGAIAVEYATRLSVPPPNAAEWRDPAMRDAARQRLVALFERDGFERDGERSAAGERGTGERGAGERGAGERGDAPTPPARIRNLRTESWRERAFVVSMVRSEPDVEVPVVTFVPATRDRDTRPVVCVASGGKAWVLERRFDWIAAALDAHRPVIVADLRYTGELDQGSAWRELYGRFFGLDEGVLAVRDLRAVLDALPDLAGDWSDASGAEVWAFGAHGAPALFAAALDPRIDPVVVAELGACYRDQDRQPRISRVLLHGDLPEAAGLVAPRRVVIGGCADPARFSELGVTAGTAPLTAPPRGE